MRRYWSFVLVLMAFPLLTFAQHVKLTSGYDGTPESLFGGWGANAENYVLLTPTNAQFRFDTIGVYLYRASTSVAPTLNVRVEIFSPNGTDDLGACACTNGPGTLLHQYPSATGTFALTRATAGAQWFYIVVPHDTVTGPFIVGIKYVSITGTGTYPSVLFDNEAGLTSCCNQYWNYQSAPGIRDNEAMFTTTPGPQYIDARGTGIGLAAPGHLTTGTLDGMGGAKLDSTVTDTLLLGNTGGTSLTIQSITSNRAAFTTDAVGSGIVIAPGATRKLGVHYTPTTAGDDTATLTFTDNVPAAQVSTHMLWGRGIASTNLMLYENWWNGADYGNWFQYRFGAADTVALWRFYYSGAHTDGFCNISAGHFYTVPNAPTVDDVIATPFLTAPASHTIQLDWREQTLFPGDVRRHGLVVADSDTTVYQLDSLALANAQEAFVDYPTSWYIHGLDSMFSVFQVGFEYTGSYSDVWYVDDIKISNVPQVPPVITASDPRSDAFISAHQIVADAFDANGDPFTVTAHITPFGGAEAPHNLTETPANSGHYCLEFTSFLTGAGSYAYYLTAQDANGSTRWPTTGSYTFDVQSDAGATELTHHNGIWHNAHYYNNMASMDAERFTPAAYPFLLTGAKVGILNGWPDMAHQQFEVEVFAGDGAGGLPGTMLYDQVTGSINGDCAGFPDTTFTNHFADVVFFPTGMTINSGTFYIAVKNPSTAVAPATEGWTFDSLGHGTTFYFDAGTSTWSLQPDSNGTLMVSAIGFAPPAAPHLAVYPNNANTAALIYVQEADINGLLPYPMNLFVSTPWTGTPALVAGSPFTTSPITFNYPGNSSNFFYGDFLANSVNLSLPIPATTTRLATSSIITPADRVPVRPVIGAETCTLATARPAARPAHGPSLMVRNEATGETRLISFLAKRGKPTSVSTLRNSIDAIGPVRAEAKIGSATARAF